MFVSVGRQSPVVYRPQAVDDQTLGARPIVSGVRLFSTLLLLTCCCMSRGSQEGWRCAAEAETCHCEGDTVNYGTKGRAITKAKVRRAVSCDSRYLVTGSSPGKVKECRCAYPTT